MPFIFLVTLRNLQFKVVLAIKMSFYIQIVGSSSIGFRKCLLGFFRISSTSIAFVLSIIEIGEWPD